MGLPKSTLKLNQAIAITLICLSWILCLSATLTVSSMHRMVSAPIVATYRSSAQVPDSGSIDADRGAARAEEASDKIFDGLDTTKRVVGKTDKRNEVIQKARETASGKLQSLSDRAEQVPDADTLAPPDRQVLDQIQ